MNSSEKAASAILEISAKHSRSSVDSLADAVLPVIGVAQAAALKQNTRQSAIALSYLQFDLDPMKKSGHDGNQILLRPYFTLNPFRIKQIHPNSCTALEPRKYYDHEDFAQTLLFPLSFSDAEDATRRG